MTPPLNRILMEGDHQEGLSYPTSIMELLS